ncbi:MAG: NAD(P)H-dependent oxidoreductase [Ruminococcus sp.]|nr:NAD(P)H-dependent oxidoreductase [Ruminococcus sp.]
MKTLVIYYSQAMGNTRRIAEMIHKEINCDIAEIDTVIPYTGSYEEIVEQGQDEVNSGFMPDIQPLDIHIDDYDRIILGTPTWWYTMTPAMKTFLQNNNLFGKNVYIFQTHGGWQGHVFEDMKKMIHGNISGEFAVQFDSTGGDELITPVSEIEKWILSMNNSN